MALIPHKKPTIAELEDERDRAVIEEETLTKQAESAERRAVIGELEKKYGKSWTKILGVNKLTNLSTLRSFLKNAKQGMEAQAKSSSDTPISKMFSFRGITKA